MNLLLGSCLLEFLRGQGCFSAPLTRVGDGRLLLQVNHVHVLHHPPPVAAEW
jgi:hypothetical protein